MFQKAIKRGFQIFMIPVICGIIGLILLAGVFFLPTNHIYKHVRESVAMLNQETDYFSVTPNIRGSKQDNYSDAIALNEALISTQDASLMDCILSGYVLYPVNKTGSPVEDLTISITNPENAVLYPESKRFFNGYEVLLKPLLLLTDYSGIRQINLYCGFFLVLWLLYLMFKKNLTQYILPFLLSILFIRPLAISLNMTFFGFYVCMLIPCIIILSCKKETLREKGWLLFGISGAVTYYLNVNYFQLICFGIPMLFYLLIVGISEKPFELVKTLVYYFFVWMVGLIGMMVFKWVMYAIFIDPSIFRQMIDHFFLRAESVQVSRLSVILINGNTGLHNLWWDILEFLFVIVMVFRWVSKKIKPSFTTSEILLLVLMFLLPFGRYLILSNHAFLHEFTMYRILMIPVLAFNLLLAKGPGGRFSGPNQPSDLAT